MSNVNKNVNAEVASKEEKIEKVVAMTTSKNKRAEERRQQREVAKKYARKYSYAELEKIVQASMAKYKENMSIQFSVCLANVLQGEPYDFSTIGVCDTIDATFNLIDDLNNDRVPTRELLEVASKHGVTLKKTASSVQVILDRGDDNNGGEKDS